MLVWRSLETAKTFESKVFKPTRPFMTPGSLMVLIRKLTKFYRTLALNRMTFIGKMGLEWTTTANSTRRVFNDLKFGFIKTLPLSSLRFVIIWRECRNLRLASQHFSTFNTSKLFEIRRWIMMNSLKASLFLIGLGAWLETPIQNREMIIIERLSETGRQHDHPPSSRLDAFALTSVSCCYSPWSPSFFIIAYAVFNAFSSCNAFVVQNAFTAKINVRDRISFGDSWYLHFKLSSWKVSISKLQKSEGI